MIDKPIFEGCVTVTDKIDMANIMADPVFLTARELAEEMVLGCLVDGNYHKASFSRSGIAGSIRDGELGTKILRFAYFELNGLAQFGLPGSWFWFKNE